MIKFFRKIRFDLMEKNRTGKYLKYAIGEIILVMIGILLAIQANQWRQDIAQEKLEIKLLNEVQKGMLNDQVDVNENLNATYGHNAIRRNQEKCINWLKDDGLEIPIDSLIIYFSISFRTTSFLITNAPFDALKEFGLNNMNNDSLKYEIQMLYDVHYPEYRRTINRYYELYDEVLGKGENYFEDLRFPPSEMKPYDIEALKKDKPFIFSLIRLRSLNEQLIYYNNGILDKQSKILKMLDQELQNN